MKRPDVLDFIEHNERFFSFCLREFLYKPLDIIKRVDTCVNSSWS